MRASDSSAGTPSDDIVPARWFGFIASWTLRRSSRRNDYAGLIRIQPRRQFAGWSTVDIGPDGRKELVEAIAPTIRVTDLIGEMEDGGLGILVTDADEVESQQLVDRVAEALSAFRFSAALTFAIGFAVCPVHGVDMPALIARADSHPVLNVDTRLQPADLLTCGSDHSGCRLEYI